MLKIDIEFIRDLRKLTESARRQSDRHPRPGFGHQTVAEGIEDLATLALLCEQGVDYSQGSHRPPAPIDTLWIVERRSKSD